MLTFIGDWSVSALFEYLSQMSLVQRALAIIELCNVRQPDCELKIVVFSFLCVCLLLLVTWDVGITATQSPVSCHQSEITLHYRCIENLQIARCRRLGLQQSCKVSKQLLHNLHLSLGLLSIPKEVSVLQAILENHSKRALLTLLVKVQVIIQGDLSCSY